MATTADSLRKERIGSKPLYIYPPGIRAWHWIHGLSIIVLCVSGYFIANPLPSLSGEASDHFLMGNIRLVHFIAAYVFAIGFVVRIYLAIVGNEYARELFVLPLWSRSWWKRAWHELKFYSFMTRKIAKHPGHNPLGHFFIWIMNFLLVVFMICTGFALYSQGTGAGSWPDKLFGWVFVLEPSSQAVRMWHLMGMWLMVFFIIMHIYMVIRADIMSRQNSVSIMITGWRRFKDDGPVDPQ